MNNQIETDSKTIIIEQLTRIIEQLTESLTCATDEIEDVVNQLNMTEYWVLNHMLDVCEDNEVMRESLKESFNTFIDGYDVTNTKL